VSAAAASTLRVRVERLAHAEGLELPDYATDGSAGVDLRAAVADAVWLAPGARRVIPTGLRLAIPPGWEGQVRARSGLALRHGLALPNAPGTIDCDYRGEVGVLLANLGDRPVRVVRGDRIAQLIFAPVGRATIEPVHRVDDTPRGDGGFGSTGSA
jgi:dUTP pyrophosphatase